MSKNVFQRIIKRNSLIIVLVHYLASSQYDIAKAPQDPSLFPLGTVLTHVTE